MMIPPASNLGIELKVLAEQENSSAKQATTAVGDFTDIATVLDFASSVDVITFDHEHVPIAVLEQLEEQGISVQPPSKALVHAQNKLVMRKALDKMGAPNPIWSAVSTGSELDKFISEHGPEVIVKTPIGGYDGKGVRVVSSSEQVSDWLSEQMLLSLGGQLLVEQKVPFKRELAQLSARNQSGEFVSWPVVETRQKNGVCSEVLSPAPNITTEFSDRAVKIARLISESLGVTGTLAVEMFETASGELLVNELAMRPHNSGHFTIEGSATSQFEQHLRAVLNLPLGKTDPLKPIAVMANVLGVSDSKDFMDNYNQVMTEFPQAKIHSYGKSPRMGRKLGHVTVVGTDLESCLEQAQAARDQLNK
ncbi:MAG: 5-(carboxyamino)imidazole ribonucleotide synthase [Actinobacteria bacterium]|nr:5-(carboxyamino)imidazole ribonucleotide synthase [Actinomycetota bacterium]